MENFPPEIWKKTGLSFLLNIVLDILETAIRQEKLKKKISYSNWKGREKIVIKCRLHGTLYRKSKNSSQNLLELINEFSKVAAYKISIPKSVHSFTVTMKYQKELEKKQALVYK